MSHTMQDIDVSGTFQEYMESVAAEVERQLGCDYVVELENMGKIAWFDDGVKYQAYIVEIFDNEGWRVHFSICEKEFDNVKEWYEDLNEFDRHKLQLKGLTDLASVRFVDAEWSLKRGKEHALKGTE